MKEILAVLQFKVNNLGLLLHVCNLYVVGIMTVRIKALQAHNKIHPKVVNEIYYAILVIYFTLMLGQVFIAKIVNAIRPTKTSAEISEEG